MIHYTVTDHYCRFQIHQTHLHELMGLLQCLCKQDKRKCLQALFVADDYVVLLLCIMALKRVALLYWIDWCIFYTYHSMPLNSKAPFLSYMCSLKTNKKPIQANVHQSFLFYSIALEWSLEV